MQKGELTIGIGQEDSHQVAIVVQEDELKQRLHQLVFSSSTRKVKDRSIMCYTHKNQDLFEYHSPTFWWRQFKVGRQVRPQTIVIALLLHPELIRIRFYCGQR